MRYEAIFRIEPQSFFGLPEGDKTVVPAEEGGRQLVGPVLDSRSGKLVAHGTLSEFRSDEEKIEMELKVSDGQLRVSDNFFVVAVEAEELNQGIVRSQEVVERLLRHLMVEQGEYMRYDFLQIQEVDPPQRVTTDPLPHAIDLGAFTVYNLEEFGEKIRKSAARTLVRDERLDRALVYYEHGRLLYNLRGHLQPLSGHHSLMVTSSYLNLWKALTTVLGDPSTDRDYQSRFREFGFPKGFWDDSVRPLKDIRDSSDVAHYSMDPQAIRDVETAFGELGRVCRRVIVKYADHLLDLDGGDRNGG